MWSKYEKRRINRRELKEANKWKKKKPLKVKDTLLDFHEASFPELNLIFLPQPRPIKSCPRLNPNKPNQQGQEVTAN